MFIIHLQVISETDKVIYWKRLKSAHTHVSPFLLLSTTTIVTISHYHHHCHHPLQPPTTPASATQYRREVNSICMEVAGPASHCLSQLRGAGMLG